MKTSKKQAWKTIESLYADRLREEERKQPKTLSMDVKFYQAEKEEKLLVIQAKRA